MRRITTTKDGSPSGKRRSEGEPRIAYKWQAFTAIGISFFTSVMTTSMVFVALSAIADDFGVTLRAVTWVVIVEALIISAILLPMGRVGDTIGRKRMHIIGLSIFGLGALLTGLAPTFSLLIAARVVMTIGNAMIQSVGTAMVVSVFPSAERGKAVGSQTTAVSIGGASGPIVAGVSLQFVPWEMLFFGLLVPIGIALIAAVLILDESKVSRGMGDRNAAFDWGGAVLSGLAVVALVLTINNPFAVPWLSPLILGGGLAFIALMTGFIRWEMSVTAPMMQLKFFRNRVFSQAVGSRFLGFIGGNATRFLLPIHLISVRGLTEGSAGLVLFLISLGMGTAAQVTGRLSDRFGERRFFIAGFAVLVATSLAFAFTTAETPLWILASIVLISGLGNGTWNVPNNSTILGSVPASNLGVIGAFTNLTRNVGNVIGQAVSAAVVVGVMASRGFDIPLSDIADTAGAGDAFIAGWRAAYLVVSFLAAIGLGLAIATRPIRGQAPEDEPEASLERQSLAGVTSTPVRSTMRP